MKKQLVALVFIILLISACHHADESKKDIRAIQFFPEGMVKVDQLVEITNGDTVAYFQREYYEDGILLKEGPIKNEKTDGLWKSYRKDGILWSEGEFAQGIRNGISNTYYPNGSKYYEGFFTNNAKDSVWRFWREDGSFIKEIDFRKN